MQPLKLECQTGTTIKLEYQTWPTIKLECQTGDRRVASSRHTGVTVLYPLARHYPMLSAGFDPGNRLDMTENC